MCIEFLNFIALLWKQTHSLSISQYIHNYLTMKNNLLYKYNCKNSNKIRKTRTDWKSLIEETLIVLWASPLGFSSLYAREMVTLLPFHCIRPALHSWKVMWTWYDGTYPRINKHFFPGKHSFSADWVRKVFCHFSHDPGSAM